MSDIKAPDRIWAFKYRVQDGHWIGGVCTSKAGGLTLEYIRADLVPQWQPIETSPENEQVYAWNGQIEHYAWFFGGAWHRVNHYGDYEDMQPQPSHWMPLPKAPT